MRKTFWLSVVGLVITTLTVVAGPASADSGAGIQAFRFFRNLNSRLCLDIDHASQAPGAVALQWTCIGDTNQRFEEIKAPGGGIFLKAQHSSQCLDVFNADLAAGTKVIQWPCNGDNNQRWRKLFASDGTFLLQAVHSGLCLDILFGAVDPGIIAIQWNCHGGASQRWF